MIDHRHNNYPAISPAFCAPSATMHVCSILCAANVLFAWKRAGLHNSTLACLHSPCWSGRISLPGQIRPPWHPLKILAGEVPQGPSGLLAISRRQPTELGSIRWSLDRNWSRRLVCASVLVFGKDFASAKLSLNIKMHPRVLSSKQLFTSLLSLKCSLTAVGWAVLLQQVLLLLLN